MNTYLKVTILVLAVVCLALAGLVYRSQKALADMHPMIVRINDVGQGGSDRLSELPVSSAGSREQVLPLALGRTVFQPQSVHHRARSDERLYFLNGDVQRAVIDQERKDNIIQTYIKDSTLPYVDVEVKNVVLDDLASRHIRRESSSRRSSPIPRIIPNSSGSDGPPASPMSSART